MCSLWIGDVEEPRPALVTVNGRDEEKDER
jgi:hypothetical protein